MDEIQRLGYICMLLHSLLLEFSFDILFIASCLHFEDTAGDVQDIEESRKDQERGLGLGDIGTGLGNLFSFGTRKTIL